MADLAGVWVVIDQGSTITRAGVARLNPDAPSLIFSSELEFQSSFSPPYSAGVLAQPQALANNWSHVFSRLNVKPEEHSLIVTDGLPRRKEREYALTLAFEAFLTRGFMIASRATCALMSTNRSTGVVVRVGGTQTQVTPIYEAVPLERGIRQSTITGHSLTTQLMAQIKPPLTAQLSARAEFATFDRLKRDHCFVPLKTATTPAREAPVRVSIQDGRTVTLSVEARSLPGQFFGESEDSLPSLIESSIHACDPQIKKDLMLHILVTGGTTHCPGFLTRLKEDVEALDLPNRLVDRAIFARPFSASVESLPDSCCYRGAVIVSETATSVASLKVTKAEYDELGPSALKFKTEL